MNAYLLLLITLLALALAWWLARDVPAPDDVEAPPPADLDEWKDERKPHDG